MNLVNVDSGFIQGDEIKYSNGIQSLGDEMARLVFSKNNKDLFTENNIIFTYSDFLKRNLVKPSGSKKRSIYDIPKIDISRNNSTKMLPKGNVKIKSNKKLSFCKNNLFPIKKVITNNKNKFEMQFSRNINNKVNENGNNKNENNQKNNLNNDNKNYVKINNSRISVIDDIDVYIKRMDTNPNNFKNLKMFNKKNNYNNDNLKNNDIRPEIDKKNNINKINNKYCFTNVEDLSFQSSNTNIKIDSKRTNKNILNKNDSNSDELDNIEIEILPNIIEDEEEESTDSLNNLIPANYIQLKNQRRKGEDRLYYIGMSYLRKKEKYIKKEREKVIAEKLRYMQSAPKINNNTYDILSKDNKKYVPIHQRAAQIHSIHLNQNILYEIQNKMKKEEKEKKELEEIEKYRQNKSFNEKNWNNFILKQQKWKEEKDLKRKAAENTKYQRFTKNSKNINYNSRNILNNIFKKNVSMDDAFTRLYNDFEDRGDRQNFLNNKYMPSFKPKPSNQNYTKFINKKSASKNKPELIITNFNRDNYFLDSQISIDKNYTNRYSKSFSRNKCKFCILKNEKYKNKNKNNNKTIDNSSIYINKSTVDDTMGYHSRVKIDPFITTESCVSNNNNKSGFDCKIKNNHLEKTKRNHNKKRLHKFIRLNKNIKFNNVVERNNQKIACIFNNYNNNNNSNKKNLQYNKTISVTRNEYKKFFNIENIEEL